MCRPFFRSCDTNALSELDFLLSFPPMCNFDRSCIFNTSTNRTNIGRTCIQHAYSSDVPQTFSSRVGRSNVEVFLLCISPRRVDGRSQQKKSITLTPCTGHGLAFFLRVEFSCPSAPLTTRTHVTLAFTIQVKMRTEFGSHASPQASERPSMGEARQRETESLHVTILKKSSFMVERAWRDGRGCRRRRHVCGLGR